MSNGRVIFRKPILKRFFEFFFVNKKQFFLILNFFETIFFSQKMTTVGPGNTAVAHTLLIWVLRH